MELHTHHQVVVEELGRMFTVGADAAHLRGQMDDQIRFGIIQQTVDVLQIDQVVLRKIGHEDILRAAFLQLAHHNLTQKTGAAGHTYSFRFPEIFLAHSLKLPFPQ